MHYHKIKLYLGAILLVAAVLRFYGLHDRGLFYADETRYYRDSVRAKQSILNYFAPTSEKGIRRFFEALSPPSPQEFAQKPGHSTLGMIGLFVFGDHQCSVLFMNAILSIATVLFVFLIGYRFYGPTIGLIAALLLAVCPAHVLFSRSFLAHSDQTFFVVLAAYLYLLNTGGAAHMASALSFGYAFLVHPSGLICVTPFLLCEIFLWLRKRRALMEILLFIALFLLPFLTIEIIAVLGKKEIFPILTALRGSYGQQLFLTSASAAAYGAESNKNLGPFHLITMTALINGIVFTVACVWGGIYCFFYPIFQKKATLRDFVLGIIPVCLFLYWQFVSAHERLFREIVFLFPFFCMAAAVAVFRFGKKVIPPLAAVIFLGGIWYSSKVILIEKSEYPKIEKFIMAKKINKIMTPSGYLATTRDVLMPNLRELQIYCVSSIQEMKDLGNREGVYYCIISPGDWLSSEMFRFSSPPLAQVPEPTYAYFPFFYESLKASGRMDYLKYRNNKNALMVSIYDIRKERL